MGFCSIMSVHSILEVRTGNLLLQWPREVKHTATEKPSANREILQKHTKSIVVCVCVYFYWVFSVCWCFLKLQCISPFRATSVFNWNIIRMQTYTVGWKTILIGISWFSKRLYSFCLKKNKNPVGVLDRDKKAPGCIWNGKIASWHNYDYIDEHKGASPPVVVGWARVKVSKFCLEFSYHKTHQQNILFQALLPTQVRLCWSPRHHDSSPQCQGCSSHTRPLN